VITGTDAAQEWLLPWWWSRYQETNDLPVTFCDFGMTKEARLWCQERGEVVEVNPTLSIASKDMVNDGSIPEWEGSCWYLESVWDLRKAWFKKPFALLHSRYEKAIWIDLDCEILQKIDRAFEYCSFESEIAMVRELEHLEYPRFHPKLIYNGGVIVFNHGASIIEAWVNKVIEQNHIFVSDDVALSHLIWEKKLEIVEIPPEYNWRINHIRPLKFETVILHWIGKKGKDLIKNTGGLKPAFDEWRLIHRLPR
jgi:hypothetical protein